MPRAVCLIKDSPPYPHPQFQLGLAAAGFEVSTSFDGRIDKGDVLLMWNRMGSREHVARQFEALGCPVLVAENGWIGSAPKGGKLYALCLNHHNGAGRWRVGDHDRLPDQRIEIKPWRESGRHILVVASRGIGEPGVAQPRGWHLEIARALKRCTDRPIRVRPHPGDSHASLDADLQDCHAVVTWASGGAIKALAAGVPVFYHLPSWIGAEAARFGIDQLERPNLTDRVPMFQRLAWAQWSAAEITTGAPIRWLLGLD